MKLKISQQNRTFPFQLLLCGLVGWTGAILEDAAPAWAQEDTAAQEAVVAPVAEILGAEELRKLVAPIALYPDDLLAVVLPASTNPLQIVQAQRFLDKRKTDESLQPDTEWDPSVLALLNYPEVLSKMNADLEWTENLGNAVIDQQADVMDMIQQIRAEAYAGGYLQSNDKQVVVQEEETVIIQPADPEYIYVPEYDPEVVYVQHYDAYPPPVYATPYPYYWSPAATFFTGAFVGAAFAYGFDWGGDDIDINVSDNVNIGDIGGGDRFNGDRQRVNGSDKLKWNGNKARQKQATGKKRAAGKTAGTLPAKRKGTGAGTGSATQKKRAGDRKAKGGNSSALGNYQSGREAGKSGKKGKQSLQSKKSRQKSGAQSTRSRSKQKAGAFGGYGGSSQIKRQSSRGKSSGRSGGGGRRR